MKVRVYKTGDEVVIDCPVKRYQDTIEVIKHPWRFQEKNPNKDLFTMEIKTIEEIEALITSPNEAGGLQFYYDGDFLKHDNGWNTLLMNPGLIREKYLQRLTKKLDEELEKPSPNIIEAMCLQRKRERIEEKTEKEIYQQALINLDEDGLDKSEIRVKLQNKINELED